MKNQKNDDNIIIIDNIEINKEHAIKKWKCVIDNMELKNINKINFISIYSEYNSKLKSKYSYEVSKYQYLLPLQIRIINEINNDIELHLCESSDVECYRLLIDFSEFSDNLNYENLNLNNLNGLEDIIIKKTKNFIEKTICESENKKLYINQLISEIKVNDKIIELFLKIKPE